MSETLTASSINDQTPKHSSKKFGTPTCCGTKILAGADSMLGLEYFFLAKIQALCSPGPDAMSLCL
jgi:hypothetical protein